MKYILILIFFLTSCSLEKIGSVESSTTTHSVVMSETQDDPSNQINFSKLKTDPIDFFIIQRNPSYVRNEILSNVFLLDLGDSEKVIFNFNTFEYISISDFQNNKGISITNLEEQYLSFEGCKYYYITEEYEGENCDMDFMKSNYNSSYSRSMISSILFDFYDGFSKSSLACLNSSSCNYEEKFSYQVLSNYLNTFIEYIETNYDLNSNTISLEEYRNILTN